MSADEFLQFRVLRCRYNKFILIFKPLPPLLQSPPRLLASRGVPQVQFKTNEIRDLCRLVVDDVPEFICEGCGGDHLVVLLNACVEGEGECTGADGLNEEFICPPLGFLVIFRAARV